MDKRTETLQVVLTPNAAGWIRQRAARQKRSVSTVLALLVAGDMEANADPYRDYSLSEKLVAPTNHGRQSNVRAMAPSGERKPPVWCPTTFLKRTAS